MTGTGVNRNRRNRTDTVDKKDMSPDGGQERRVVGLTKRLRVPTSIVRRRIYESFFTGSLKDLTLSVIFYLNCSTGL